MVASLSTGRAKYADHEPMLAWALETGAACGPLPDLADEDAAAYAGFAAALKLPRETDEQIAVARPTRCGRRPGGASEVPLACVEACLDLVGAAEALAGRSNANASCDLDVAALLGEAAARGAAANVLVNLPLDRRPGVRGQMTARVTELLAAIEDLASQAHQAVGVGRARADPLEPRGRA